MAQNPEILYKLMVLYMLDGVSFPLTNTQLAEFFLDTEYTTYFTLQRVINELEESGFINSSQIGNSTHYDITDDGRATLRFFKNEISSEITSDIDQYLKDNKFRMRSEVNILSDYYRPENGDYVVRCRIRDGRSELLSIDISVPDEKSAETISANWKEKAQPIYQSLMQKLI